MATAHNLEGDLLCVEARMPATAASLRENIANLRACLEEDAAILRNLNRQAGIDIREAERLAQIHIGQAWQREDITRAERDEAIRQAEAAEALAATYRAALIEPVNDHRARPKLRGCKACYNLWKKGGPEKHLAGCVLAPAEAQEEATDD